MNHKRISFVATLFLSCATLGFTSIAAEQDSSVDKPLILELQVLYGGSALRQEILVSEGKAFRVVTRKDRSRVVVEGNVERIANGVALVNLKVSGYGPFGLEASQRCLKPRELKVNEFRGGGGGSSHLGIGDLWIRRGIDAIPIVTKQLSGDAIRSASAAYYLGELGAEAKPAIPALEQAAESDDPHTREAARAARDKIAEIIRKNDE